MAASNYLAPGDLARLVRLTAGFGVMRYRLTGGEPLLRRDIVEIVELLRAIEGVRELSMTTNASRLREYARPLRSAGLDRINISLDSLDAHRFARVTGIDGYAKVRDGITAAVDAGFPVKINVVVLRDMPDDEILEFARFAYAERVDVRFLEFMPLSTSQWNRDDVYPVPEVRALIERHFELHEIARDGAPARTFQLAGGRGRVGFIAPLSEPFCSTCSRIRLTADGQLRPCLFSDYAVDLGARLRAGADDTEIATLIRMAVFNKPRGSQFSDVPLQRMEAAGVAAEQGPPIRAVGG